MKRSRKYISKEQFDKLKVNDVVKVRFMIGKAIIKEIISDDQLLVTFKNGCWNGKDVEIIRQQISKY